GDDLDPFELQRLLPVFAPQVGHHGDERAGDGEAGLDGIVHLEDLQIELAPEEVKDLRDVGDVAPAQLDAVAAGDELEDAPPEIRTLFSHESGGPLVRVEDVPGIAKQTSQSARADHAQARAGLRVEEVVLHVHRGEAAVLD